MCNIGQMTFIFKLDLGVMKVNMSATIEDASLGYLTAIVLKSHRQTDRPPIIGPPYHDG